MSGENSSLRQSMTWGIVAFGAILALVVGIRLDQAALTVIVGVACGVGASIPTGLLVVTLLQRRNEEQKTRQRAIQSPPVVIVAPPAAPQLRQPTTWPQEYSLPIPVQRQFSVIGEEEIEDF